MAMKNTQPLFSRATSDNMRLVQALRRPGCHTAVLPPNHDEVGHILGGAARAGSFVLVLVSVGSGEPPAYFERGVEKKLTGCCRGDRG